MGRRGQKKAPLKKDNLDEELLGALFQPMAPNKRAELNAIVENLLNLSSNFTQDDPTTPSKLYEEFEQIFSLVSKIRNIEMQGETFF